MDKNATKKYAVWARREMIDRVRQKAAQYGITDSAIIPADAISIDGVLLSPVVGEQRKALIQQINVKGYQEVMEEVIIVVHSIVAVLIIHILQMMYSAEWALTMT